MIVHGNGIEPGGMALEDAYWEAPCPHCRSSADHGHIERLEGGSINIYHTVDCIPCGHHSGFDFLNP